MNQFDSFVTKELRKNQKIIIKNIPQVTYEEVKTFLGKFSISNIAISKRLKHAIVDLKDGLEAEAAVDNLQAIFLHGQKVEVSLFRKDNLLCIANLPVSVTHQDLKKFIEPLGAIEKCCVWIDKEGHSLGYAFFELQHNRDLSELVRVQLDGRIMDHQMLVCDFVNESILSLEQFQSKVVVVTGWMEDVGHMDSSQLYRMASMLDVPVFCDHTCHGGSTCFGVVEFKTGKFALMFYELLSKHRFMGHSNPPPHMEGVYFSCPGYTGQEVYRRVSNSCSSESNNKRPSQQLVNPRHLMSSNPTADVHKDSHPIAYPPQSSIFITQPTQSLVFLQPPQVVCRQNMLAFTQKPAFTYLQTVPMGYVNTTPLVYIPVTTYYGVMPIRGVVEENPFGVKTQMNDCGIGNGQQTFKQNEILKHSAKENLNKRKLWRPKIFDELRNKKKEIPLTVGEMQKQNTNFLSRKRSYRESYQQETLNSISNVNGALQPIPTQPIPTQPIPTHSSTTEIQNPKHINNTLFYSGVNLHTSSHAVNNADNSIHSYLNGNLKVKGPDNVISNSVFRNKAQVSEINGVSSSQNFMYSVSNSVACSKTGDNSVTLSDTGNKCIAYSDINKQDICDNGGNSKTLVPEISVNELKVFTSGLIVDRTNIFDPAPEGAPLLKKKKVPTATLR